MPKSKIFFVLFLLVFALSFSFKANEVFANDCVPLPAGEVPNETDPSWTRRTDVADEYRYGEGGQVAEFYVHANGMKLATYSYFEKIAYKAWSCDKDSNPDTGDTSDHMIAVAQPDGSWFVRNAQEPDLIVLVSDYFGHVMGVVIILDGIQSLFLAEQET